MRGNYEALATAEDVDDTLAFALRFQGREGIHNADELIPAIVVKRVAAHLGRSVFVVMNKTPIGESKQCCAGSQINAFDSQNDR